MPQAKAAAFANYTVLDRLRGEPHIAGHERIADANCTIVEIAMERNTTRKLWIDAATHLVRKDTLDSATVQQEALFTTARLGEKLDPALFTYDPAAAHAQNRHQLAREAPATLVGQPAPDFTLHDLDGREFRLSALRGKAVLLDFWGAWCGFCREALPGIEMIHRGLKDKGLLVFGIDSEAPEIAHEYLQKYGYTFPSLIDRKEEAVQSYHLESWPTTVLIDREGKIVYYGSGDEPQKLRDAIRAAGVW
jgi:peroxiredoxin